VATAMIVSSLSAALLDLALAVHREGGLRRWVPVDWLLFTRSLATALVVVSVLNLVGFVLLTRLIRRSDFDAVAISWGLFVALATVYVSAAGPGPLHPEGWLWWALLGAAAVISAICYLAVSGQAQARLFKLAALSRALPFLIGLGLALGVAHGFLGTPYSRVGVGLMFLAVIGAVVWLSMTFDSAWLRRPLMLLYVSVLVSPILSLKLDRSAGDALSARPRSQMPHVVLITIDTLRPDALSCYEPARNNTPNIDRLCRDGLVFTNAFSPAPWTLPALASILTGTSPLVHGASRRAKVPRELPTLAQRLRQLGYRTHAIVANPAVIFSPELLRGFERWTYASETLVRPSLGQRVLDRLWPPDGTTDAISNGAVSWLQDNGGRPFFLWLHYFDPHLPYAPPARYFPKMDIPSSVGRRFSNVRAIRSGYFVPSRTERVAIRALYDAEVRYVDEGVGRVLDELERRGLYEEALVVLSSDHGEEFWDHQGFEHGHSLYNELLRVPLVIKLPGTKLRRSISKPVSTVALMSTVLEACGDRPALHTAPPLQRAWEGATAQAPGDILLSTGALTHEPRIAVLFDPYKYIRGLVSGREELYDLSSDAREQHPLTDAEKLATARTLVARETENADQLRRRFGLPKAAAEEEPAGATTEQLRALGYVQ
jgi:arylsulfatase A-like enzyme